MSENINMQMEAENADLFDRQMMALYGAQPDKPTKVHMATDLFSKVRNGKQDRLFLENVFRSETKTSRKGPKAGILGNLENLDIDVPLKSINHRKTII